MALNIYDTFLCGYIIRFSNMKFVGIDITADLSYIQRAKSELVGVQPGSNVM